MKDENPLGGGLSIPSWFILDIPDAVTSGRMKQTQHMCFFILHHVIFVNKILHFVIKFS